MKKFSLGLFLVMAFSGLSFSTELCPDGSYAESQCNLCPDGSYHDECGLCPDGHYGCSTDGGAQLCPDGSYHTSCGLCPNGQYGC